MSSINVDNIRNRTGGAINVPAGSVTSGVSTATNKIEVRSDDNSPGRIDYYCESNNAHYTRVQAAPHSEYSGNATVILPTTSGDLIVGDVSGSISQNLNTTGIITATTLVKSGGTSSQFLKADGSVDNSTYLTTELDPVVGAINGIVKADGGGNITAATAGTDYLTPTGDGSGLTGVDKSFSVGTPSTSLDSNGDIILTLDLDTARSFTYTVPSQDQIGIVSFTNVPAVTGTPSVSTVNLKVIQNAQGTSNTASAYQVGQINTIVAKSGGTSQTPITNKRLYTSEPLTLKGPSSQTTFEYKIFYDGGTNTNEASFNIVGEKIASSAGVAGTDFTDLIVPVTDSDSCMSLFSWSNSGFGPRREWKTQNQPIRRVDISPNGKYIAGTSQDYLYIYDFNGVNISSVASPSGQISDVKWSPSGSDVAISINAVPNFAVYPVSSTGILGTKYDSPTSLHPNGTGKGAVAWHPSGNYFAAVHYDSVGAWPWTHNDNGGSNGGFGTLVQPTNNLQGGAAGDVAWSPDGNDIVACDNGGNNAASGGVYVWPWTGTGFGTRYDEVGSGNISINGAYKVAWAKDGRDLFVLGSSMMVAFPWTSNSSGGSNGGYGTQYTTFSGTLQKSWASTGDHDISVSPDGQYIAVSMGGNPSLYVIEFVHNDNGGSNDGFNDDTGVFQIPIEHDAAGGYIGCAVFAPITR